MPDRLHLAVPATPATGAKALESLVDSRIQAANKLLANNANAVESVRRAVGVLSEHHEELLRQLGGRHEMALAGITQMLVSELCAHRLEFLELLQSICETQQRHSEMLNQIHRLGCWWDEEKER